MAYVCRYARNDIGMSFCPTTGITTYVCHYARAGKTAYLCHYSQRAIKSFCPTYGWVETMDDPYVRIPGMCHACLETDRT